MKKSITVNIPVSEKIKPLNKSQCVIKILEKKPLSAKQLSDKMNISIYNIHPVISNLKKDGLVSERLCQCCQVGKKYEVNVGQNKT